MDRRTFTIRGVDDYERALHLIGYQSDNSDQNANDSSDVDSVVDLADVNDPSVLSNSSNSGKCYIQMQMYRCESRYTCMYTCVAFTIVLPSTK